MQQQLLLLQPPVSVDVHDAHVHDGCDVTGGVEALWVLRECTGVPCWTAGLLLLLTNATLHPTKL